MTDIKNIDAKTLKEWLDKDQVLLIDVREPAECLVARIEQAINVPLSVFRIEDVISAESESKKIVIQCRSGVRSMSACVKLMEADPSLELYNFGGGILEWNERGYPIIS
ncbi:MAG: rhodanese-like domain-containing protein [Rickettsiaceae bacterium]|nr:rhodanese-like domain-containing protein [Rickettsiaceae bacterium]